jgi:hypothetical protein
LVFRHSFDGKRFAAKGVSEQVGQGFHLAPSAFFRCLDNTGLKPTHVFADGIPLNGLPLRCIVGNRTSLRACRSRGVGRHLRVSFLGYSNDLVLKDQMDVCSLSRRAMLSGDSARIRSITEHRSLFPSSCTHPSIGFPYG